MKTVIIDSRMPRSMREKLSSFGYDIISLPSFYMLDEPVSSHPDMLIFFDADKTVCHSKYYEIAKEEIDKIVSQGYKLVLSDEDISGKYPHDILFNCFQLGGKIYGRTDSMSLHIKEYAKRSGLELVNVAQGYAKCSTVCVGHNAIITSDPSIKKAAAENGADILTISSGGISLPPYDTGFIGGCTGLDEKTLYFSGNIHLHPDGKKIVDFCLKHGVLPICLSDEYLTDVGTMFFI